MSTRGVETRFVNVVRDALENDGVVNEEAMKGSLITQNAVILRMVRSVH